MKTHRPIVRTSGGQLGSVHGGIRYGKPQRGRRVRKPRYVTLRVFYNYPWAMFTICKGCKEFLYCRGRTRDNMKCRLCACGTEADA